MAGRNQSTRQIEFLWPGLASLIFRARAVFLDHLIPGALPPSHTSKAPGNSTQEHAQAQDFNTTQGRTQDMEATSANLLRNECKDCGEPRGPSHRTTFIESSGATVTSMDSADRRLRPVGWFCIFGTRSGIAFAEAPTLS